MKIKIIKPKIRLIKRVTSNNKVEMVKFNCNS